MKKIREWYKNLKINRKFTVVTGLILFGPMVMAWFFFFQRAKNSDINEEIYKAQTTMEASYNRLQNIFELSNMTMEGFTNNGHLTKLLIQLNNGEKVSKEEFTDFEQNDIVMMEQMVVNNPYLYQVRVYANNNEFSEIEPILYHQDRMEEVSLTNGYESGKWYIDYEDTFFTEAIMDDTQHLMYLVTAISDAEYGEIGTLEVAVLMDDVFPEIFQDQRQRWSCFMDKEGNVYSGQDSEETGVWDSRREEILQIFSRQIGIKSSDCFSTMIGDEEVILCYRTIPELGGYFITVSSLSDVLRQIKGQRNMFLLIIVALFLILIVLLNAIVKSILKNFYTMLGTIRQVQMGNLNIRVDNCGMDELGELGNQFNVMLDRIESLMNENINREVLAKNSEIRALQNQINAHFIYNVLESIKMMAEVEGEFEISDAITSLGKLLRYSMQWTSPTVTVEEELEYIRNYMDLINLRFDYRINLAVNMPRIASLQQIPKMSLQPIVENAIIHGVEELAEDATIYIKAAVEEDMLTIEVTDSGKGMTPEQLEQLEKRISGEIEVSGGSGNNIGLKNVQDRIHMTYGDQYGIRIVSKIGCFTKVIVQVPIYKGRMT